MRDTLARVLLGYVIYRLWQAIVEDAYAKGYHDGLVDSHNVLTDLLHDHEEDRDVLIN